mmetsp:Transcript_32658/g.68979  ORF Transcript_32658/g.68979 Transcript_32658/m.68979 type:complete len:832 (-) Transcript_32658:97-2592(-)
MAIIAVVHKIDALNMNLTDLDHDIVSTSSPQIESDHCVANALDSGGDGPEGSPSPPVRSGGCGAATAAAAFNCDDGMGTENNGDEQRASMKPMPLLVSHSSSMGEFSLIREEDADILEQGVEEKRGADLADFDDHGRRLEACGSSSSLADLDDSEAAASGEVGLEDGGMFLCGDDDGLIDVGNTVDESRNDLSCSSSYAENSLASPMQPVLLSRKYSNSSPSSSNDISLMPPISEDPSCHTLPDPAATEKSPPQSHMPDIPLETLCEENNDYFLGSEIDHEALAQRIASGRAHHRSNSFDRRMSESAQFAEAVGEDSLLLKKIIEEDSSSDFDDDEIDEHEGGKDNHHVEEILTDHGEELQNIDEQTSDVVATEDPAGMPPQEKIEPICVSTDLTQMSADGEECSNQQHGSLPQLSTTLEVGTTDSAPTTPAPSPYKPSQGPHATSFHPPCYVDWKFTRQNSHGSNMDGSMPSQKTGYRGIRANPPEITKRGMARGNYAQLHRKAWLEVSDKHHRYGKNLRMYYKHWEELGHPFHMFFDWLDSKGEALGNPLPNLPEIPRPVLDSDTVLYITNPEISSTYALGIVADPADGSGIIVDQNGDPINTGNEGWIFILRDHVLYGSRKVTAPGNSGPVTEGESSESAKKPRQRFHHSSFFGGKAVASAGIFITNEQGRLTRLYPHSGHYRPGEAHMQRALFFFQQLGVELSTFTVDMQQIFKVSRKFAPGKGPGDKAKGSTKEKKDKENNGKMENGNHLHINNNGQGKYVPPPPNAKKSKKTDCLHLMCGMEVACFLAHKALMIEKGVFHQIHKIRRIPKESRSSVSFILSVVNE